MKGNGQKANKAGDDHFPRLKEKQSYKKYASIGYLSTSIVNN